SGKNHNEFFVPHDGPGLDILVSMLVMGGIGALFVGLARLLDERKPRDFTIGPDATTLFNVPGELLPVASFPLVRSTGTDYELLFTRQMTGDVTVPDGGGQAISLEQLAQGGRAHASSTVSGAYAYVLPNGARAK